MDLDGDAGENEVIRLLRRQAVVARGRERVRLAAAASVGPTALAGSVLISATGFAAPGSAAAAFVLLLAVFMLVVAVAGWWIARALTSRIPRWPQWRWMAPAGVAASLLVVVVVVVLLASSSLAAALVFALVVVGALGRLWVRRLGLDRRFEELGHQVAVAVGYR
jgi:peptidoglycan/LPS O-acetylase OafA/YrhL